MSLYIALINYTDKGMADIEGSPARLDKARALLRDMGGDFKQVFLTIGTFDMIVVYDAPDDATSARFPLRLGKLGYVRTCTLKAFPETAYREIIKHLGG
jgi:uncharacterized protein with GYD domain